MANVYACLYDSWGDAIADLTDNEAGKLLKAISLYRNKGCEPTFTKNRVLRQTWRFIKQRLDNNTDNYSIKADAGKKGGQAKASKAFNTSSNANNTSSTKKSATDANVAENAVLDNKNLNLNENENLNENLNESASAPCTGDAQSCSQPPEQDTQDASVAQPLDFVSQHNAEYTAIVNAWNSAGLPHCTKTMLVNMSNADNDLQRVRGFFDAYGGSAQSEAISAIRNFAKMRGDSRYDLGYRNTYSFFGFLEKGVGAFVDSAKPFEYFTSRDRNNDALGASLNDGGVERKIW